MIRMPIHHLCLLVSSVLLAGCASREPSLYYWGSFQDQQYHYLLHEDATVDEQIRELEAMAERASAEHRALPPGFRAHLGLLHLEAGRPGQARELWQAEMAAFPESAPFISRQLIGKLDAAAGKAP